MRSTSWLIAIACLFSFACEDEPPDKVPPLGSRVELAAGDVWLTADGERSRLITGAMLPEQAGLEVGQGGRALVRLGSGTGAFFRGGSEALVQGGSIALKQGEMWTDVPADEQELGTFKAGDVTVTASGAGLDIAVSKEGVKVYVARGLAVVASSGGRAEVQSGEQALVSGKGKPEVGPVSFWEDWTGGMADRELLAGIGGRAAGKLYGIDRDRPGSPPQEMQITYQAVRVYIRDGIAHTTVDQRFFNPTSVAVEGWYWFTVPEGASVDRFAWEVNGVLVDGEMIERKQAAATYEAAVQARTFDPALLEWVDGRTFRARIFPVPATGERRVVLSYTELLPLSDGVYRYVYPMGGEGEVRIQEFSLEVNLGDEGEDLEIATLQDAKVEQDRTKISMRRSGFVPRSDFLLEIRPTEEVEPLRAMRFKSGKDEADYVMLRYSPEVEWGELKEVPGDVVVVLDTSAGGDDSERQIRSDAVEAILRALSAGDHFAVVAADLIPRVVYPSTGMAKAEESEVSAAMEALSEVSSAGATDLGEMFHTALELVHESEQPAVVYVGDGRPTVGEVTATELAERLRRSLGESRARLFTIAVGAEANHSLLERLARVGGGRSFRIDQPEQTVQEALRFAGMVKTPTLTDLAIDAGGGLDQLFSTAAGKISEGEEVVLLARTHHALPDRVKVTGRLGGKDVEREYDLEVDEGDEHGYIPPLWARLYLERLMGEGPDENRGTIISLGLSYSLMTPFTSFLVLESQQAYRDRGMPIRQRFHWSRLEQDDDGTAIATGPASLPLLGLGGCMALGSSAEDSAEHEGKSVSSVTEAPPAAQTGAPAEPAPAMPVEGSEATVEEEPAQPAYDSPKSSATAKPRSRRGPANDELDGLLGDAKDKSGGDWASTGSSGTGYGGGGKIGGAPEPADTTLPRLLAKLEAAAERKGGLGTAGPAGSYRGDDGARIAITNPYVEPEQEKPKFDMRSCSDASRRPLYHRRILWQRRLAYANEPGQYLRIFSEAGERCELPNWRARKVLLDLIEGRVRTAEQVSGLIEAFGRYRGAQSYLRRRIMRHALDPDLTMGLWFGHPVNWGAVERGLTAIKEPKKRLEELRKIMEKNPSDPAGRNLLVATLFDVGENDDARAEAARLRRDGLASPVTLAILCDLQAAAGLDDDARRSCSELVEFNADDTTARQRLGDLFLRHGWYGAAYRQYRTLVDVLGGSEPAALLRLAAAAAGMGKVDEALRIERKVSAGDGEPGPADPRRWARLHSAVRLSRMILEAGGGDADKVKALERSLKRTQVASTPTTLVVLVWEDLETVLELVAEVDDEPFAVADKVVSPRTGLMMLDLGETPPAELELSVKLQGIKLKRAVGFTLMTIAWDGKSFTLTEKRGQLPAEEEELSLSESTPAEVADAEG